MNVPIEHEDWYTPIVNHLSRYLANHLVIDVNNIYVQYSEIAEEYVFYYENQYICYGSDILTDGTKALRRDGRTIH